MSNMRDQIHELAADAYVWSKSHPVIVCMGVAFLAVFVIGFFAGRA